MPISTYLWKVNISWQYQPTNISVRLYLTRHYSIWCGIWKHLRQQPNGWVCEWTSNTCECGKSHRPGFLFTPHRAGLGTQNRTYGPTHPHLNRDKTGCRGRGGSTLQYSRVHYATAQRVLLTQDKHSTLKPPAAPCLSTGMSSSHASSVRNTTAA